MSSGRIGAIFLLSIMCGSATGAGVEVRVVEEGSGSPVGFAVARVFTAAGGPAVAELDADGAGCFRVSGLPAGEYRIDVTKPNYVMTTVRVRLDEGQPGRGPLVVRLIGLCAVTGRVTDAEGRPIRGAKVLALTRPRGSGSLRPRTGGAGSFAPTEENGEYRLYNLPPGQYAIAVLYGAPSAAAGAGAGSGVLLYPDNAQPRLLTVSGGEEVRDVNFTLPLSAPLSVSGNVQAPEQNAGFWVAAASKDQASIVLAATQAEADGSFRLDGMAPGSYDLFASGPIVARSAFGAIVGSEPLFGRTRVEVGHQNVNGISIAVDKGRAVTVVVRAESGQQQGSACPATATLALSSVEDWGAVLDRTVQVSLGRETLIGGLAPARYQLHAQLGDACFQAADTVLDLTSGVAGEPVEVLVAPGGSVRGRLTGAAEPTAFAIELAACGPEETAGQLRIVLPDAESCFAFDGLRPGRYRIAARPISEAPSLRHIASSGRWLEIEVRAGATTELELPAAAGPNQAPPDQARR